jgi:hypothetical protein
VKLIGRIRACRHIAIGPKLPGVRVRFAVPVVTALATVALTLPGGALAIGSPGAVNPLAPGIPASPAPTPTAPTPTPTIINPTTTSTNGSLSGGGVLAIAIGAIVLLGGISFFIWRDARRRAPVRHAAHATAGADGRSGSKRPVKPRKLSAAEKRRRKRGRAR